MICNIYFLVLLSSSLTNEICFTNIRRESDQAMQSASSRQILFHVADLIKAVRLTAILNCVGSNHWFYVHLLK